MQLSIDQAFDLASTLESGQAFRWRREGQWYHGVIYGNAVQLRQHLLGVEFRSSPTPEAQMESTLRDYLRLDDDLEAIYHAIDRDEHMRDVIACHRGMRLLRQEPWECLIAFILSANSNIPRISATMENMSRRLGRHLAFRRRSYYTFPAPEVLVAVGEKGLRALGLGFRARSVGSPSTVPARRSSSSQMVGPSRGSSPGSDGSPAFAGSATSTGSTRTTVPSGRALGSLRMTTPSETFPRMSMVPPLPASGSFP